MIGRTISHYEIAEKLGEGELRNGHCGRKTLAVYRKLIWILNGILVPSYHSKSGLRGARWVDLRTTETMLQPCLPQSKKVLRRCAVPSFAHAKRPPAIAA